MSKNRGSAIIDYENGIILIKRILKEDLGFKGLDILYDIVINWINNPYMLFRHYSIYYFIKEFEKYEWWIN